MACRHTSSRWKLLWRTLYINTILNATCSNHSVISFPSARHLGLYFKQWSTDPTRNIRSLILEAFVLFVFVSVRLRVHCPQHHSPQRFPEEWSEFRAGSHHLGFSVSHEGCDRPLSLVLRSMKETVSSLLRDFFTNAWILISVSPSSQHLASAQQDEN